MAHLQTHNGTTWLSDDWHIEDVRSLPSASGFSDEQCVEVLGRVAKCHDAYVGINWDVLEVHIRAVKEAS